MSKEKTEKTENTEQYNRNTHKIYTDVASIFRNSSLEFTKITTNEFWLDEFPVIEFIFKASIPKTKVHAIRRNGDLEILSSEEPGSFITFQEKDIELDDINLLRATFNMISNENDSCKSCVVSTHQKNSSDDILMTCKFFLIPPEFQE